jgi:hypothetical protein
MAWLRVAINSIVCVAFADPGVHPGHTNSGRKGSVQIASQSVGKRHKSGA